MTSRLNPGSRPLGCAHTHTEYSPTIDRRVCLDCGRVMPKTANKYGNRHTYVDGVRFDSKREADAWQTLKADEAAGKIRGLQRQVPFPLVVNGVKVCVYRADFTWIDAQSNAVIADAKGFSTPTYLLKKALMRACLGLEIREL